VHLNDSTHAVPVVVVATSNGWRPPTLVDASRGLATAGYSVAIRHVTACDDAELDDTGVDLFVVDTVGDVEFAARRVRQLRAHSETPVIAMTAERGTSDELALFDAGADDCVPHGVQPGELARRVRAVLRRRPPRPEELHGPSDVVMHVNAHKVTVGDHEVRLTRRQYEVLHLLLDHRGEAQTADQIALAVWGHETLGSRNFVEAHISRVRTQLARAGARDVILTLPRVGYVIR
jgi:DNA-binding response OmpR family regulator